MTTFPIIKTCKALITEGILPCSEETIRTLAKRHGIGRILGRTYVFTPDDIERLIESLPRPSFTPGGGTGSSPDLARPSPAWASERALALIAEARARKKRGSARKSA